MIKIRPSPTADTRTCDYTKVTKETLLKSSEQHIWDIAKGLCFFVDLIHDAAVRHDHDKLSGIDQFHSDFVTGFKEHSWWDNHRKVNRHHLTEADGVPVDVDLIDVLDFIVDCVMAGKARSGTVRPLTIAPEVLQRAFENTAKMLEANVEVVQDAPRNDETPCGRCGGYGTLSGSHGDPDRKCPDCGGSGVKVVKYETEYGTETEGRVCDECGGSGALGPAGEPCHSTDSGAGSCEECDGSGRKKVKRIFLLINEGKGTDWVSSIALAEDGTYLAGHISSDTEWAKHDIGLTSDWKHDLYRAHYPDGYEVEWVENPLDHSGVMSAYRLNQEKGRQVRMLSDEKR